MTDERKLATIEAISALTPIEGADAIEAAQVRGWTVVVKKGEFTVGSLCVYIEIDSMLNVEDKRFEFLTNRGVRANADGQRGHVLKTIRLRGVYSQGLVLPLSDFPELEAVAGADVTEQLGIVKYEPPIPANLQGRVRGNLPGWVRRTDEERIENQAGTLRLREYDWVATEKLDGSSCSMLQDPERDEPFSVCSRNLQLIETPENSFWAVARQVGAEELLTKLYDGQRVALQGELFGEGVQGNPLKLQGLRFAVFSLWVDGTELPRAEWPAEILDLSVPVYDLPFPESVEQAQEQVTDLKSLVAPGRNAEGVVWRVSDRTLVTVNGKSVRASAKVVSRKYLLKNDR